jgi:hypothetical protein
VPTTTDVVLPPITYNLELPETAAAMLFRPVGIEGPVVQVDVAGEKISTS